MAKGERDYRYTLICWSCAIAELLDSEDIEPIGGLEYLYTVFCSIR